MPSGGATYDAFISYSHAVDGLLAPALQSALQQFSKPWYRLRALRIFRDNASLAANPALWSSIERALEGSKWFVLLASPSAANSHWVGREINTWLERRGTDRLLLAVTDGELGWNADAGAFDAGPDTPLPPALLAAFDEEPRFIDLRFAQTTEHLSLSDPRFRDAVADLAAPIHGRPKDELVGEDVRQHRRTVRLARAAAAALVILLLGVGVAAVLAVKQRNEAREQRQAAVAQERASRSRELAANALLNMSSNPELSLLLGIQAAKTETTPEAENALRQALLRSHARAVLLGHSDAATDIAVSLDRRRVLTGSADRTARLWDARTGKLVAVLRGHQSAVIGVAFSDKGGLALTWAQDDTARIWDAESGQLKRVLRDKTDTQGRLTDASFSPDGKSVATSSFLGGRVSIWDSRTGRRLRVLRVARNAVVDDVDFSPRGEQLVAATQDGTAQVWNTASGRSLGTVAGHRTYVWTVEYSSDGRRFVDSSEDGVAVVWDVETHRRVAVLGRTGDAPLTSARFSPDASLVLTTSEDGSARLWDVATARPAVELVGHADSITDADFTNTGDFLITASEDGTARVWDTVKGRSVAELHGHQGAVLAASLGADGSLVATSGADGSARLWDPWSGEPVKSFRLPEAHAVIDDASFSSDGQRVLAVGSQGQAWAWNTETGRLVASLGTPREFGSAVFSSNGSRLAINSERQTTFWDVDARRVISRMEHGEEIGEVVFDTNGELAAAIDETHGRIHVWAVTNGRRVSSVDNPSAVSALTFSPRGKYFATASWDGFIRVWNTQTGGQVAILQSHVGQEGGAELIADTVEFTPDGQLLATSGDDGTVRISDVATGRERIFVQAHPRVPPKYVEGLTATLSSSGRLIVSTAVWEPVGRIWSVSDGRLVTELAGHAGGLERAQFTSDGRFVLTTSWDGTARVWQVSDGRAVVIIRPPSVSRLLGDRPPAAALSPGGKYVLAAIGDSLRLYRCDVCGTLTELLAVARERVTRGFTRGERARYLHER